MLVKQFERMDNAFTKQALKVSETQEAEHETLYKGADYISEWTKNALNKVLDAGTPPSTS